MAGVGGDLEPMANTTPGYRHILASGPVETEEGWTGVWQREASEANPDAETTDGRRGGPANRVKATVLPARGMQAWVGNVPGGRQQAILRQEGKDLTFVCVVDPYLASDAVKSAEQVELRIRNSPKKK